MINRFDDPDKIYIQVFIIDKCNIQCEYCYNIFPRTHEKANLKAFYNFIKSATEQINRLFEIQIVGGEPTLHEDLLIFVNDLLTIKNISSVDIFTNFERSLDYYIKIFDTGARLAPSWHGKKHDLKNIQYLKKMLLLPDKYIQQLAEIPIMMEQNNFDNFSFAFNTLYPKFKSNIRIWPIYTNKYKIGTYTTAQLKQYVKFTNMINEHPFEVQYSDGSNVFLSKTNKQLDMHIVTPIYNYKSKICNSGKDIMYIHVNGNVYSCQTYYQYDQKPICNIYDSKLLYNVDKFIPHKCLISNCRFAEFNVKKS